jgi:hypothetical protein
LDRAIAENPNFAPAYLKRSKLRADLDEPGSDEDLQKAAELSRN